MPSFFPNIRAGLNHCGYDLFDDFSYYHPSQKGSASLKAVLPALTSASYDGLDIGEGNTASRKFMRVTFSDVGEQERRRVRETLEAYWKQDTQGLIDILFALQRLGADERGAFISAVDSL